MTSSVYSVPLTKSVPLPYRTLNVFSRSCAVELSEVSYSTCPLQETSQSRPGRKKSLLPVSKSTVHCPVHSKRYNVSDNSPVKVLAGLPTDIEPYQYEEYQSMSGSLPMLRFSERFTLGAEGWRATVFCW